MDRPLGRACGHSLEVEESLEGLQGRGPDDLMEVTYALGVEMLLLAGAAKDRPDARRRLEDSVRSGRALETFGRIIEAQGGNRAVVDDPALLPQAGAVEVFRAPRSGTVATVEPRRVQIDPAVGFVVTVKPGDEVRAGDPIASVFARDNGSIERGLAALDEAIVIGDEGRLTPLITHRVTSRGAEALAGRG
jgi:pyrimidine-nucleoside phosphorylase